MIEIIIFGVVFYGIYLIFRVFIGTISHQGSPEYLKSLELFKKADALIRDADRIRRDSDLAHEAYLDKYPESRVEWEKIQKGEKTNDS